MHVRVRKMGVVAGNCTRKCRPHVKEVNDRSDDQTFNNKEQKWYENNERDIASVSVLTTHDFLWTFQPDVVVVFKTSLNKH